MASRRRGTNQRIWDLGRVGLSRPDVEVEVVALIEADERRFFEVSPTQLWRSVAVQALETRFRAVGWWAIPTAVRIEDPELIWAIRENEFLDDCEIVLVDGLISLRWAARAFEKIVDGEYVAEEEAVLLAA